MLGGIGAQYGVTASADIYGNYSRAYRPILCSNLVFGSTTAVVDPNLKDARGYNADIGIRGKVRNVLNFDVSGFQLFYGNRIGKITLTDSARRLYSFTTNAGDALTRGVEAFLEVHLLNIKTEHPSSDVSIFSSYAYNDAKYLNGKAGNADLTGKTLEDVPHYVSRSGINCSVKNISFTLYYSTVGGSWSDANNTAASEKNPGVGYVLPYQTLDFAMGYKFLQKYSMRFGINNLNNNKYYSRRSETLVYVGKGVLPGDGRSIYFMLGGKF